MQQANQLKVPFSILTYVDCSRRKEKCTRKVLRIATQETRSIAGTKKEWIILAARSKASRRPWSRWLKCLSMPVNKPVWKWMQQQQLRLRSYFLLWAATRKRTKKFSYEENQRGRKRECGLGIALTGPKMPCQSPRAKLCRPNVFMRANYIMQRLRFKSTLIQVHFIFYVSEGKCLLSYSRGTFFLGALVF